MASEGALKVEALDVTSGAWEDLEREVLADDPDAVAPLFLGSSGQAGYLSESSCITPGCTSGGCFCTLDCGCVGACGCISPG